jgi:hypothetical protein
MSERGVAEIVSQSNSLSQIFIEKKSPGYGTGDLSYLQGMGKAGSVMISFGGEKDLGLVFQTAKGLAVDDTVPVSHEAGSNLIILLGSLPSLALRAEAGKGGEGSSLNFFNLLANGNHS